MQFQDFFKIKKLLIPWQAGIYRHRVSGISPEIVRDFLFNVLHFFFPKNFLLCCGQQSKEKLSFRLITDIPWTFHAITTDKTNGQLYYNPTNTVRLAHIVLMQLLLGPWRLATTWFLSKRKMFLFFFLWLRDLEFSSFKKCVGKTIWANIFTCFMILFQFL